GVVVDGVLTAVERVVGLGHLARQRRDQLRHGLGRLQLPVLAPALDAGADLRRGEVHDLAQAVLRVPGDAEGGNVTVHPRPVVLLVVVETVGVAGLAHVLVSLTYSGLRDIAAARLRPRTSISIGVPGSPAANGT